MNASVKKQAPRNKVIINMDTQLHNHVKLRAAQERRTMTAMYSLAMERYLAPPLQLSIEDCKARIQYLLQEIKS